MADHEERELNGMERAGAQHAEEPRCEDERGAILRLLWRVVSVDSETFWDVTLTQDCTVEV